MSTGEFQRIKANMVGDVAVVEVLPGELRFPPQASELGAELSLVAGQDWARHLVVNLKHTKYLSSTGFAILFKVVKEAQERGSVVRFCQLDPEVRLGAEIISLDKLATIFETEEEAIRSFAP
ncbi:STAS domain protein [Aquisphaera giovannonii]|uniref:STAS domain protein n=1 Tax=Aquisphaera giovannonii TaxID=406548 RepID=A0A5B9VY43_9BACT|nr:STAS domain-containing protein [Aquisphaera giovannonii]QEH33228.1 STAS domain protein [Aquisphaera giovannonii]